MDETRAKRRLLRGVLLFVGIPLCLVLGITLLRDRSYMLVSGLVGLLACLPVFLGFERRGGGTRRLVLLAAMTALAVVGRLVFAALPGLSPALPIVVITAVWLGPEAGFLTGAMAALLSNMYFGQGPWTPFQMFIWGALGFAAGLCAGRLKQSRWAMALFGLAAGLCYSLLMDIWTTLSADGAFNLSRYLALLVTALPWTALYAVSNIVFMLLLAKPIGSKLERIQTKYGL